VQPPVEEARRFLLRYTLDTLDAHRDFCGACAPNGARLRCSTATPATLELGGPFDGVVTSPPYPGLIDYHEQHRYAYELLGSHERRRSWAPARAGSGECDPCLRRGRRECSRTPPATRSGARCASS
jgi:hypothetical protein